MIREFGEKDGDIENRFEDDREDAYRTRVRKPWPLLKLPDGVSCEQEIGVEDEGSFYCLNYTNPNHQRATAASDQVSENSYQSTENDVNQTVEGSLSHETANGGEAEISHMSQSTENDVHQTVEGFLKHETANGAEPDTLHMLKPTLHNPHTIFVENIHGTDLPPKLEEFIPKEFFPDVLMVHDADDCAVGDQGRSGRRGKSDESSSVVYRYKRVLPEPGSECGPDRNLNIASLHLSAKHLHGVGNHSSVYRAPFILPPPLTANSRSKDGSVTVIAKTGFSSSRHRDFLKKEAHVFNTLSSDKYRHMQQEWCGLNVIRGILDPVPVGPVVPKFYGYYIPEQGVNDDKNLSPILLMEDCGMPVQANDLSDAGR